MNADEVRDGYVVASSERIDVLSRAPFFADLDVARLERVAVISRWLDHEPGTQLYDHGDAADEFFVVNYGIIRLKLTWRGRQARDGYTLGPSQVLGWAALLDGPQRRICTAESVTRACVLAIHGGRFRELMDADHTLGYFATRQLSLLITHNLRTFAAG